MVTRSFLSEYSLEDMWLFLIAVMLVVLVFGNVGSAAHPVQVEQVDDGAISVHVRAALFKEVGPGSLGVGIETLGGHVQLSGQVGDEAARRKAEEAARMIPGVTAVSNQIAVRQ